MSDSLDQLRRQRAAIQQHLDWLDGEIARAEGTNRAAEAPATPGGAIAQSNLRSETAQQAESTASAWEAEAALESYRRDAQRSPQDVKRGCWTVFAGALGLLGLAVLAWYLLRTR